MCPHTHAYSQVRFTDIKDLDCNNFPKDESKINLLLYSYTALFWSLLYLSLKLNVKAAPINILIIWVIWLCVMLKVALLDKPRENYHPTLQFPSALWSISAPFSTLFWFYEVLFQSLCLHQQLFSDAVLSCLCEKALITQLYATCRW